MKRIFDRVLFKISGEALSGGKGHGIDISVVEALAERLKTVVDLGVEVAVVVGGGNFWRGKHSSELDRTTSDNIGMLGTVMNGLALEDRLLNKGVPTMVVSALDIPKLSSTTKITEIHKKLSKKTVVIFVAGTGNPYFSTDTTAVVRALETSAEIVLFSKNGTDGCYDKDPNKYEDAVKYELLTMSDIISENLDVIDLTAAMLLKENGTPALIFGMDDMDNIVRVVTEKNIGTYVKED